MEHHPADHPDDRTGSSTDPDPVGLRQLLDGPGQHGPDRLDLEPAIGLAHPGRLSTGSRSRWAKAAS